LCLECKYNMSPRVLQIALIDSTRVICTVNPDGHEILSLTPKVMRNRGTFGI